MEKSVTQAMTGSSVLSWLCGIPARFEGEYYADFFSGNIDMMLIAEILYVLLVFCGPYLMQDRKPYNLRWVSCLWNLSLTVYSFLGSRVVIVQVAEMLYTRGFHETTCTFDKNYIYDGELAFWLFTFTLSKIPEMFDTVLLVLQKKPVIFLHWYHHLTVSIFCWICGLVLNSSGIWFAGMNYAVHSIMYLYYFFCSIGIRKLVRPAAPLITSAQLLQMLVGTCIVLYTTYYKYFSPRGCDVDQRAIRMGLLMYGSYLFLFAALFSRLYLHSRSKKDQPLHPTMTAATAAANVKMTSTKSLNGTTSHPSSDASGLTSSISKSSTYSPNVLYEASTSSNGLVATNGNTTSHTANVDVDESLLFTALHSQNRQTQQNGSRL